MNRSRLPGNPFRRFMVDGFVLLIQRAEFRHGIVDGYSIGDKAWVVSLYGVGMEFRLVFDLRWWKRL